MSAASSRSRRERYSRTASSSRLPASRSLDDLPALRGDHVAHEDADDPHGVARVDLRRGARHVARASDALLRPLQDRLVDTVGRRRQEVPVHAGGGGARDGRDVLLALGASRLLVGIRDAEPRDDPGQRRALHEQRPDRDEERDRLDLRSARERRAVRQRRRDRRRCRERDHAAHAGPRDHRALLPRERLGRHDRRLAVRLAARVAPLEPRRPGRGRPDEPPRPDPREDEQRPDRHDGRQHDEPAEEHRPHRRCRRPADPRSRTAAAGRRRRRRTPRAGRRARPTPAVPACASRSRSARPACPRRSPPPRPR